MHKICQTFCYVLLLAIATPGDANSQESLADYSAGATGEQMHDSSVARNGGLLAPQSTNQSPIPSAKFSFGFPLISDSGYHPYAGLPIVSTSSVDINVVDRGRRPIVFSTTSSRSDTTSSGRSRSREQDGPAEGGYPSGEIQNPFDLNGVLTDSIGQINGIAGPVKSSGGKYIDTTSSINYGSLGGVTPSADGSIKALSSQSFF